MAKNYKRTVGDIGEGQAMSHLIKQGYKIIMQNYLRRWGEIDIIAKKKGILYFVEVKTRVTNFYMTGGGRWRPEDNLHKWKMERIKKAIQSYLLEQGMAPDTEWEFGAVIVVLKRGTRDLYRIEHLENLII